MQNLSLTGKKFNCSYLSTLEDLKLLEDTDLRLVNLSNKERNESDVIFVSAISSNHFGKFLQMYELLKRHWPKQKVLLYSLDLSDTHIEKLEKDKNIKVRKFDYEKYPKHVENWMEYRFKALILAEAIREFPNIWWTDSHNRWLKPKPLTNFYGEIAKCQGDVDCDKEICLSGKKCHLRKIIFQKSSIMMFVNSTHSNYAVLMEGLLDYFPTFNIDTLKYNDKGLQLSAAFVYLARTQFTLDVLKWHTLCALEEKCMKPPNAKLKCDSIPEWDKYAGCFRFDQSSLNLLMFNSFRNHNHYFMNVGKVTRTYDHY
ncbi:Protein CBG06623 [Caenorhabditis briggsae]|uniref:Protein CBG06623 n=1 Tax=Caenorhabditis briggsae TaxID=6238 RepID=A8X2P5_CAEBR|nr:Protein CBG06623 [Caenorhabditis briggsae]CAP26905.2 Protein CBG06623 [Caenorhabditis briggsae]